jgi:hypothetical protein
MPAFLAPIIEWIVAVAWPAILRFGAWIGLGKLFTLLRDWLMLFFGEKVMQSLVATISVVVLLQIWAVFLLVFWNFSSLEGLREFFSANPFRGVSALAGSLYLATNFFPFHFFFGTAIAYIQWRLTIVHAAIVLNRLVRIMQGM